MAYIADEIQARPVPLNRRLGVFSISTSLMETRPEHVIAALEGCAIVRAECIWHRMAIQYIAMHADFDEVPAGTDPPTYICELTLQTDGSVTRVFRKVF